MRGAVAKKLRAQAKVTAPEVVEPAPEKPVGEGKRERFMRRHSTKIDERKRRQAAHNHAKGKLIVPDVRTQFAILQSKRLDGVPRDAKGNPVPGAASSFRNVINEQGEWL
jgi:hypothetical protein